MTGTRPTITQRLNDIADELEKKAKVSKSEKGKTVSKALDRVAAAVKKLP